MSLLYFLVLVLFALLFLGYRRLKRLEAKVEAIGETVSKLTGTDPLAPQPPTRSVDRKIRDAMEEHTRKFHA